MSTHSNGDWTEAMSAAERVEAVALTVGEPQTANWIAKEADVAHETATKYLGRLTDGGTLLADSRGQQTTYEPDPIGQYLAEMRELYNDHSPDELATGLADINDQIRTWESDYDADTPNELRASLGRTDDAADERQRRRIAREWEHLLERRRLVEDALRLYDRFPSEPRSASV